MKKILFPLVFILFTQSFLFISSSSYAQQTYFQPANYLPIKGKVEAADIISFTPQGYILSKTPYDQSMVGIITANPAVTQDIAGPIPSYPVVSSGSDYIRVSTINGTIKAGDYITSSQIPGVGMKANKTGYTLGAALSGYSAKNPQDVGEIPISINIHYYLTATPLKGSLLDILTLSTAATYEQPSVVFKYLLAGILVLLSMIMSFILISRTANKGIDALGRNPLSSHDIHIGMILNVFIAIIIMLAGFLMGYLVIRL